MCLNLLIPDRRDDMLQRLRRMGEQLLEDEGAALQDSFIQNYLSNMIWPRMCIVREWFTLLEKVKFQRLPRLVGEDLECLARSFATTRCVEGVFKIMRGAARHSLNSQLGRNARRLVTKESLVLGDCGRRGLGDLEVYSVVQTGRSIKVLQCDFASEGHTLTIGNECYDQLAGAATWPTPSTLTLLAAPLLTWSWCAPERKWGDLKRPWASLLVSLGFIIKHTERSECWLSLHASPQGVLCIRILQRKVGGVRFMQFAQSSDLPDLFGLVAVLDRGLDKWKAVKVNLLPLGEVQRQTPHESFSHEVPQTCLMEMDGTPVRLHILAAQGTFEHMTSPFLWKLVRHFELEVSERTVPALLKALLNHCLPDMAEDEVQHIIERRTGMAKRDASPSEEVSALLQEGAAACAEDVLDREEHEELQTTDARILKNITPKGGPKSSALAASASASSGDASVSASSSAAGPAVRAADGSEPAGHAPAPADQRKARFSGSRTPSEALVYAPLGARMRRGNARFYRWITTLEELLVPPRSSALVYGRSCDPVAMHRSLLHCYRWAWSRDEEFEPFKSCPYDWGEVPLETTRSV